MDTAPFGLYEVENNGSEHSVKPSQVNKWVIVRRVPLDKPLHLSNGTLYLCITPFLTFLCILSLLPSSSLLLSPPFSSSSPLLLLSSPSSPFPSLSVLRQRVMDLVAGHMVRVEQMSGRERAKSKHAINKAGFSKNHRSHHFLLKVSLFIHPFIYTSIAVYAPM